MGYFESLFTAADSAFVAAFGEPVTYIDGNGTETIDSGAMVDPEETRDIGSDRDRGVKKVRERKISLRRSIIDSPQLNGKVRYGGEDWQIVGIDRFGRDAQRTTVIVHIADLRGRAPQGH